MMIRQFIWKLLKPIYLSGFALGMIPLVINTALAGDGGWTSTGGGKGVVCFVDEVTAKAADKYLDKKPGLSSELLNKVQSVESLDLFSAHPTTKAEISRIWENVERTSSTWQDLSVKVEARISELAPLFGLVLNDLGKRMPLDRWVPKNYLSSVTDLYKNEKSRKAGDWMNSLMRKNPNCRMVQLLKRNSKGVHRDGQYAYVHPLPEEFFDFEIQYVSPLFDRMRKLDQALMNLHEKLYLMGAPLGHVNSEDIRYWVRTFALLESRYLYEDENSKFIPLWEEGLFPKTCKETLENFHCHRSGAYLRTQMTRSFGDYALHFISDRPQVTESKANPYAKMFLDYLKIARNHTKKCMAGTFTEEVKAKCFDSMLREEFPPESIGGRGNFLFLAWFYFNSMRGTFNIEYLVNPVLDENALSDIKKSEHYLCGLIENLEISIDPFGTDSMQMFKRAVKSREYCNGLSGMPGK